MLTDWDKMVVAAGGLSLVALGVYTAKGVTGVTARYIEARLGMTFYKHLKTGINVLLC